MEIYAKKIKNKRVFQTLRGHTKDCLAVLKQYIITNTDFVVSFCRRWELSEREFLQNLITIVYFHDIGKHTDVFQKNIQVGKQTLDVPHACMMLPIMSEVIRNNAKLFSSEQTIPYLELASMLGHHSQLHSEIYDGVKLPGHFNENQCISFIKDYDKVYDQMKFRELIGKKAPQIKMDNFSSIVHLKAEQLKNLLKGFKHNADCQKDSKKFKSKAVYSLYLSILKTCDQTASRYFDEKMQHAPIDVYDEIIPEDYTPFSFLNYSVETLFKFDLYCYQKSALKEKNENVIVKAGCGRGKTETALCLAQSHLQSHKINRIVFAMPTQVTSNALGNRLKEYFGENQVEVYHGNSLIEELYGDNKEEQLDTDLKQVFSRNYKAKTFSYPITVTTVDHILYSFIHGHRQADYALGNLQSAFIVFDEIHVYEEDTTNYIFECLNIIRRMKIPHAVMSATLPSYLIDDVKESYSILEDTEGQSFKPFKVQIHNHVMISENNEALFDVNNEVINMLRKGYEQGKKQIVILNTVKKVLAFYQHIRNSPWLNLGDLDIFHSRFTTQDRKRKEFSIFKQAGNKGYLLITSPIVEVSLNVSFDIMYTEQAPLDSLAQRAGRLNRNGQRHLNGEHEYILHVFKSENYLPYKGAEELVDRSFDILPNKEMSYVEIGKMLNELYDSKTKSSMEFLPYFFNTTLFGMNAKQVRGGKNEGEEGFSTRTQNWLQVKVIPEILYLKDGNQALTPINEVKVPFYWKVVDREQNTEVFYQVKKQDEIYTICRLPYSSKFGLSEFQIKSSTMLN